MSERIALFPLRTVLFPGAVLPLRIFEVRYVDMVRRCLRAGSGFGVVLIQGGEEVGPVTRVAPVGTLARIEDFQQLSDGLLGITCRGERRFRIVGREQQADGLHLGDVEWLEDPTRRLAPGEAVALRQVLSNVLAQLDDAYPCGAPQLDDALWVSSQLGQLLPVPAAQRQQLLELPEAASRLQFLEALVPKRDGRSAAS